MGERGLGDGADGLAEDLAHAVNGRAQARWDDKVAAGNGGGDDRGKGAQQHGVLWSERGQGGQWLADVAQFGIKVILDEEGVVCAGPFDEFGAPGCRQGSAVGILMAGGDDEGVETGRGDGDAFGVGGDVDKRMAQSMGYAAQAGVARRLYAHSKLPAQRVQQHRQAIAGAGGHHHVGWIDGESTHVAQVPGHLAREIAGGVHRCPTPRCSPFGGEDPGGVRKAWGELDVFRGRGRVRRGLRLWSPGVGEARVDDGAGANLGGEVALGRELVVGGDHAASGNAELRSQVAGRGDALAGQEDAGGNLGAQGRGDLHGQRPRIRGIEAKRHGPIISGLIQHAKNGSCLVPIVWATMAPMTEQVNEQGRATTRVKRGLADMLKGGVIMDVVTPEQARIAEDAGASAVMALERVPADIRAQGGVARMSDPELIEGIVEAVDIPVMAKARIGHFVEAQILGELGVDFIDESEVLSPADYVNHINKWDFDVPFVCGATNLGEALRRITEGAAMIRSKGEAGTGDVSEAVKHLRTIKAEIARLRHLDRDELYVAAKELQAPYDLVAEVAETGKLPVVLFVAGGVATPADAALVRQMGAEGVFVGSGIFKSGNPAARAEAIVKAATLYDQPAELAKLSRGLGEAMVGINVNDVPAPHRLAERGW